MNPCDMRLPLSHLRDIYAPPTYEFEPSFAELDSLWTADERESTAHRDERARSILDVAFAEDATCA